MEFFLSTSMKINKHGHCSRGFETIVLSIFVALVKTSGAVSPCPISGQHSGDVDSTAQEP